MVIWGSYFADSRDSNLGTHIIHTIADVMRLLERSAEAES